jgi:hypothetical protein
MSNIQMWEKTKIIAGLGVIFLAAVARGQVLPAQAQAAQQANRQLQLQQFEQDTRLRANPDIPTDQRLFLDYGGYFSFDYLSIDDAAHDNHGLRQYELVGYVRANLDGAQEVFLRGRTDYRDYNPGDSFDGFGSRLIDPDFDRAYYRVDFQRLGQAAGKPAGPLKVVAEAGRDLDYWGNGLVLTEVLDGGRVTLESGPIEAQLLLGITPTRTVDIDTSRPEYSFNTRRLFTGAMVTANAGDHHPFVYFLHQHDENEKDFSQLGVIDTSYRYNSYYLGVGSQGTLSDRLKYGVEAAFEGGHTLSSSVITSGGNLIPVPQTSNPIQAWALNGRLDYITEGPHQTRFTGEMILASGDHDRGTSTNTFDGSAPGTIDRGFNGFGLLNTGLAFSPEVSNLMVARFGTSCFPVPDYSPMRKLQIGADFFVFGKLLRDAPIDEPTTDHRYLGFEPDVYVNWQLASDVTLALRYGVFFPNRDAFGSGSPGDSRQFFYGGLTFAF